MPLPLRQGRAVRHTHDYKRNGVLDLYAALNVATGHNPGSVNVPAPKRNCLLDGGR